MKSGLENSQNLKVGDKMVGSKSNKFEVSDIFNIKGKHPGLAEFDDSVIS